MTELGSIKPVSVREIWPNEARDFTPWLAANISRLGAALGMDLEVAATEAEVGDFSLDVLAKDLGTGRNVAIENQFGATDHDHLGKLLTYGSGVDAGAVIWVTETVREEHRQTLEWLNRRTDADLHFFLVVLEVIRIDESRPAVIFKPIVSPNDWQRLMRESADRRPSAKGDAYQRYFQALLDELRDNHRFTSSKTASPRNWQSFSSGISGIAYGMSFATGARARVELYLNFPDVARNKALFDRLLARRADIEASFGEQLEWERLEDRCASRIAVYRPGSIEDADSRLQEIRAWSVQRLLKLRSVFGSLLQAECKERDAQSATSV